MNWGLGALQVKRTVVELTASACTCPGGTVGTKGEGQKEKKTEALLKFQLIEGGEATPISLVALGSFPLSPAASCFNVSSKFWPNTSQLPGSHTLMKAIGRRPRTPPATLSSPLLPAHLNARRDPFPWPRWSE